MIPPDGLHTNDSYPDDTPVLSTPRKVIDYGVADFDRRAWVLTIRPSLIAAGNLVETEEHRKEFRAMTKAAKKEPTSTPAPLTQAVRTTAGDFVPPVDRKSMAAGDKDDQPEAGCPF